MTVLSNIVTPTNVLTTTNTQTVTNKTFGDNPTFSGGTANGVTYLNGSKVLTSGSALQFTGSNLSIGIAASANEFGNNLQINQTILNDDNAGTNHLSKNAYYSSGWKYISTDYASKYTQSLGTHQWSIAPSGTAGNAVTFTEGMRLTSTGLGIGTSSPTAKVHAYSGTTMAQLTVDGAGAIKTGVNFASAGTTYGQIYFDNNSPYDMSVFQQYSTGSLRFGTNNTERARIDSSGNLLVGTTTVISPNPGISLAPGTGSQIAIGHGNGSLTGTYYAYFVYNGTIIGSITQSGTTAVLYNTTSDQRLKENIQDADSASSLIDSLQVRKFDWKADGSHQRYGFVAQELVTVYPEAVHQPIDTEDMMAVDYSKLVPLLVKEIQSLKARLDAANL